MATQTIKEQIIDYVDRAIAVAKDCHLLFWVRTQDTEKFDELTGNDYVGGGNFLIGIGCFVALNYLAKIYALLKNKPKPITEEQSAKAAAIKEELVTKDEESERLIITAREGVINETDAFMQLIKDAASEHRLGLPLDDNAALSDFYDRWRNRFIHMIVPERGTAEAFKPEPADELNDYTWEEILAYVPERDDNDLTFRKDENGHWYGIVDFLAYDVQTIAEWLKRMLTSEFSDEDCERCLHWIEMELTKAERRTKQSVEREASG